MFAMNEQFAGLFKNFQPANEQFTNAFKNLFPAGGQFAGNGANVFAGNEQFLNAAKSGIDSQVSFLTKLSATALDSTSKVVELNMSAAKTAMEESTVIAKQFFASKTPQEALQLLAALPQPNATKAAAYTRHLTDITSTAQAELARVTQEQVEETIRKFVALIDEAGKNAPAGSENVISMLKLSTANVSAGYEQLNKVAKQATEAVQANAASVVEQATQVGEQVAAATGRTRK
jgi:phasin family protein